MQSGGANTCWSCQNTYSSSEDVAPICPCLFGHLPLPSPPRFASPSQFLCLARLTLCDFLLGIKTFARSSLAASSSLRARAFTLFPLCSGNNRPCTPPTPMHNKATSFWKVALLPIHSIPADEGEIMAEYIKHHNAPIRRRGAACHSFSNLIKNDD